MRSCDEAFKRRCASHIQRCQRDQAQPACGCEAQLSHTTTLRVRHSHSAKTRLHLGPLRTAASHGVTSPSGNEASAVNIRLYALQLCDISYNWGIFLARGRTRTPYSTVCRRRSRPRASHWSDPADVATQSATIQQPGQLTKCARVSYNRILTVCWTVRSSCEWPVQHHVGPCGRIGWLSGNEDLAEGHSASSQQTTTDRRMNCSHTAVLTKIQHSNC